MITIQGHKIAVEGSFLKKARLDEEWYEDVTDPQALVHELKGASQVKPDLFTFWQRLPDTQPKYSFYRESDPIAVIPVSSYQHWFKKQIKGRTRGLVRKAEKQGVVIRQASWDDRFVEGMTAIFNETPVRQGRRFWHYGKDFETVKREFSRYLFREDLIGAYLQEELIGFVMLAYAGPYALTGQVISKIEHRDKATNNALIAKAVELCARKNIPYLVYLFWTDDSLAEFKRRNGFEKVLLPRYYVPLTFKGRLALRLGLHRGVKQLIPAQARNRLKNLRGWINSMIRYRSAI